MRGYHACEFCSKAPLPHVLKSGKQVWLGSAEIWIPSTDGSLVYAAPDLVYHYVTAHQYRPPDGFIEGVIASGDSQNWNAESESERRLQAAFSG